MFGDETSVLVTARIEPEVRDTLKRLAREDDRTLSSLIRHNLKAYVTTHAGNGKKEDE